MGIYFGFVTASMGLGKIVALVIAAPLAEAGPASVMTRRAQAWLLAAG